MSARQISEEERETRRKRAQRLREAGTFGGRQKFSGRPRKGETREEARARREREADERAREEADPTPRPAHQIRTEEEIAAQRAEQRATAAARGDKPREEPPAEPADPRIMRAMAAGGHRLADPADGAGGGPPGGPKWGESPYRTSGTMS
jgi:hypothetical protein